MPLTSLLYCLNVKGNSPFLSVRSQSILLSATLSLQKGFLKGLSNINHQRCQKRSVSEVMDSKKTRLGNSSTKDKATETKTMLIRMYSHSIKTTLLSLIVLGPTSIHALQIQH